MRATTGLFLLLAVAGCSFDGGLHRQDDRQVVVEATYANADPSEPFLWQGLGTADSWALMVGYARYWRDRIGLQAKLTPVRIYDQGSDGNVYAAEFQIGLRWYLWEIGRLAVFLEGLAGISAQTKEVPQVGNGTKFNFTQDTGVGLEYMIDDSWSVLGGYRYSHLSNFTGTHPGNPSQNDHEFWLGVGFSW